MDHNAVISKNPDGFARPVHVQCSCNTAGDFASQQEASDWINLVHFSRIGPTENSTLTSTIVSAPPPAEPPIGGV